MSDYKANQFQYQSFDNNQSPNPNPNHSYGQDLPITPPPYTPFPDHNSYMPNLSTTGIGNDGQPIFVQPMPVSNAGPEVMRTSYGTIVQTVPQTVIFIGSCPACRVGILEEDFTCLGILLAILLFPLGILCCLALRQRRCPNCGATFE